MVIAKAAKRNLNELIDDDFLDRIKGIDTNLIRFFLFRRGFYKITYDFL